MEEKYDHLKKNNRQLEQSNLLLKNDLDKEKAIFKEKERNWEKKIIEVEDRLQNELMTYNKVIENINEKNNCERERLNREIEKLNKNIM